MLCSFPAVFTIRRCFSLCFLPAGSQYSGYLRRTGHFACQSKGKIGIKAQACLPEIDIEELHHEVYDGGTGPTAEAMPARLIAVIDLQASVSVTSMKWTLDITCSVRMETVSLNDLSCGKSLFDFCGKIRTVEESPSFLLSPK